jgi:peroxiredoxin
MAGSGALFATGGAALLSACGRRDAAPEVPFTLLDGSTGHTAALRGKVSLLNFWATSCAVCVQEMPALAATWRRFHARGFELLAVAMPYDPPALVARYAETRALPFGVVIDNTGAITRAFGHVRVTPTTFVIDKRGAVAWQFVGAPDFARLHERIESLLTEPG